MAFLFSTDFWFLTGTSLAKTIFLIFLVVLLLFGAKRLPEIGSSLGKGIREFKTSMRDVEGEIKAAAQPRYTPPPIPAPYHQSQQPAQIAE